MEEYKLQKYERLKEMGVSPYISSYKGNSIIASVIDKFGSEASEVLHTEKPECEIAGRIVANRPFGKVTFFEIRDSSGSLQVYVKKDFLSEEDFRLVDNLDTGDHIAVKGFLFKTKTGELTLCATSLIFLSKSLRDLPEKWHGLKDVEKRYRHRYLDLISNSEVKEIFVKRSKIINYLRQFFMNIGFIEVETPMMQAIAGGAAAKPFTTHHNALDMKLYLRISPELYLKRLIVGGFDKVFEINRNFRNEGISVRHNPEFTMIEWYSAYTDYSDLMDMVEEFFIDICKKVNGTTVVYLEDHDNPENKVEIDLKGPWPRMSMRDSLVKVADISEDCLKSRDTIVELCRSHHIKVEPEWGKGRLIMELFELLVEDKLINPTFITDYPKEVSPLAKSKVDDPEMTERFEMFVGGIELVNGFNELNDPFDQKERFLKQVEARERGDEEANMMDIDYIHALEHGMPPTAGAGMGVDRFVMLLCGKRNIKEVLLFPHMRPE